MLLQPVMHSRLCSPQGPLTCLLCYRVDHLRKLKRNGADMDHRDMDDKTACQWAVSGPGLECLSAMLTPEQALATDRLGRTVLHYAAEQDTTRTIKYILHVCPHVLTARDHSGRTALHYAGVCGSARAARTLLKRGADPTLTDVEGRTALDYARQMQQGAVAALLGTYGADGALSVKEQQASIQPSESNDGAIEAASSVEWCDRDGVGGRLDPRRR